MRKIVYCVQGAGYSAGISLWQYPPREGLPLHIFMRRDSMMLGEKKKGLGVGHGQQNASRQQ